MMPLFCFIFQQSISIDLFYEIVRNYFEIFSFSMAYTNLKPYLYDLNTVLTRRSIRAPKTLKLNSNRLYAIPTTQETWEEIG